MLGFDFGRAADLRRYNKGFDELLKLGSGGFSTVYRMRHKLDNRQYAIKVIQIKPSLYYNKPNELYQHFEKMLNETKILASLSHPNVLRYHGCWIECVQRDPQDNQLETQQLGAHTHAKDHNNHQNYHNEPNRNNQQHHNGNLNRCKVYSSESENDFQMVMYDQESNSGIEFVQDSSDESKRNSEKELMGRKPIDTNKNASGTTQEASKASKQVIATTESLFGTNIFEKFKEINVYIQTEAGEKSLQHHVQQRNFNISTDLPSTGKRNQKDEWLQNYKYILDLIRGLSYIHSRKIIHRDLKLQNVIIDSAGHCKIIDFGLAKKVRNFGSVQIDSNSNNLMGANSETWDIEQELTEEEMEKYSSSVGTKIFSSPEQASSNKYDHRTDIYSLGMIISILFSRFVTVYGERQLLLDIRNRKLNDIQMDSRLKEIILRCLSQEKMRPSLNELEKVVKTLMREELTVRKDELVKIKHQSKTPLSSCQDTNIKEDKLKKNQQNLRKSIQSHNSHDSDHNMESAIKVGYKDLYFTKNGRHFSKNFSINGSSEASSQVQAEPQN